MYKVTRLFTAGTLAELTHTCVTSVNFELEKEYNDIFGSPYRIINIEKIGRSE